MNAEPRRRRFTIQIDAAVDEHAFAAPSFRFRFLDGSKKQTPVIGTHGWTMLASSESANESESSGGLQDRATSSSSPSSSMPANTFRYDHVVADVNVTEAFVTTLDDDPILSFFFADHAGLASGAGTAGATQTPPASHVKDAKGDAAAVGGSKAAVPATPGESGAELKPRAYAGLYELDVSSLLAGHLQSEQCWADSTTCAAIDSGEDASSASWSVFSPKAKKPNASSPSQSLFAMLPPEAAGLRYLAIRVRVDQPLLSAALVKKFNPLTITLNSIRRLPGIASRAGNSINTSGSDATSSSPHAALRQSCRPVYASFQLFPDRLRAPSASSAGRRSSGSGLALPRRLVVTSGKPQNERADWHHHATFLTARFHRAELLDALQFGALAVEVHDRDLAHVDRLQKLISKWETLYMTGVDVTTTASTGNHNTAGAEPATTPAASASRATTPRTTPANHPQQAKPLDIFAVDDVARRDCRALLQRAGELFPHGLATFRLDELLNTAKQLVGDSTKATPPQLQDASSPFASYKLTTDVVSVKRRAKPLGAGVSEDDDDPLAVFDLTPTERLVREPGAYLASSTALSIVVTLQHAINPVGTSQRRASLEAPVSVSASAAASSAASRTASSLSSPSSSPPPCFSRMVLVISYKDTRTLHQVARVMSSVNLAALPGVPLRSYQLTASEQFACASGKLDIVTGAQVIDSEFRTIVLEGLADGGMKRVHEQIQRPAVLNDPCGYRMCANEHLRFPQRLYTAFAVDLKRIKLRSPLPMLLQSPDIYMRAKVSESCYRALTRLADVRRASCLEELARLDLFPTAQMLVEVESKYGESITLEDIHGNGYGHQHQHHAGGAVGKSTSGGGRGHHQHDTPDPIDASAAPETPMTADNPRSNNNSSSGGTAAHTSSSKHHATMLKAPTDSTNDAFEQLRKSRKDKDFIAERRKELEIARTEYADKKRLADAQAQQQQSGAPVYMYSGQKLRTQDALQDEMRQQLAKDHRATYTYSREFQSLAVSLVDTDALRQTEARADRQLWTTQRGFVYPPPRQPSEYYKHARAPSEARCEDLRQPFVDNANQPQPVSRSGGGGSGGDPYVAFSTLPSKDMVFGGTNADGSINTEYFRSVHLCGEGLRREQDEALRREQEEWERRVVVDRQQLKFLAHGNTTGLPRAKPAQLDKIADLLAGPVRSKPLRIVRNATLPSGKRVPLAAPPVTIHNQQEYAGSVATQFATALRATDATRFVAHSSASSDEPQDFHFPSVTHVLTPPVKQHVTHREISAVATAEKSGLLWRNG